MPSSVLVLGSGGREHALAWRLSRSPSVSTVYLAPGNASLFPTAAVDPTNADSIVSFCQSNSVDLVVVGPEAYLAAGVADSIGDRVAVFGPVKAAAQLESSKVFSKEFMKQYSLPTAAFNVFTNTASAEELISSCPWETLVVKADGLAAGKGVVVASSKEEALDAAKQMLEGQFGDSSRRILIEEGLRGYEVSALCFTDGTSFARMPLIRDHKRLLDGDQGPNTGGMGVVGPVAVPSEVNKQIDDILEKTLLGLKDLGIVYKGVIYAGFMVTASGPQLLEYNCRFGDPETEILMRLLESDLYKICKDCVAGTLNPKEIAWSQKQACGVILAAKDYPAKGDKGTVIEDIPDETDDVVVFHCGTAKSGDKIVTNGGRILCATALASTAEDARKAAVAASEKVRFEGKFFRRDIGVQKSTNSITYGDSGVDVAEGNAFVDGIKNLVKATLQPGTGQIGGFGAVIDTVQAGYSAGSQLVVGIDGVGTKIEVADAVGDFSGVGCDVVAMCVNDVLCHCAAPIAFLDYFVTGALNRPMATQVVASIANACKEVNCSLVGGETAEMPGVYGPKQWDLAGCAIAVREPNWPLLPQQEKMNPGDVIIGLHSSGVHSNGFSLVRKILALNKVSYHDKTPWDQTKTFGETLLAPTRLYVRQVLPLLKEGVVSGCAHITGGGIKENATRVLSTKGNLAMEVDAAAWKKLPLFDWLAAMGPVEDVEMLTAFNCGIGMILVVNPADQEQVMSKLRASGESPVVIGKLIPRPSDELIHFKNLESAFHRQLYALERKHRRVKVGVLISGTGSNMVKIVQKAQRADSNFEVVLVVSNKPGVKGLEVAEQMGIKTTVVPHTKIREEGDAKLSATLKAAGVELVCLAGYMRLLTATFVKDWPQKIINVHPSLLPSFKGAHAVTDAISFGAKVTGCSVHFVDEEMDHGKIIAQAPVIIEDDDTEATLHTKIQKEEHRLFPEAVEKVASKLLN